MASPAEDRSAVELSAPMMDGDADEPEASEVRLRSLLNFDRESAGEKRALRPVVAMETAAYSPSLEARWRQFQMKHSYAWRSFRQRWGRKRVLLAGLLVIGMFVGTLRWLPASDNPASTPARPQPVPQTGPVATAPVEPAQVVPAKHPAPPAGAPPKAAQDARPPAPKSAPEDAKVAQWIAELSPHGRVVRADALLRNPRLTPARRARLLLESVLAEETGGAHAQAALAEACLRTGDHACAREAVEAAIRLRPWRGGYRSLKRSIVAASAR